MSEALRSSAGEALPAVVWKFPLMRGTATELELPADSVVLAAGVQGQRHELVLWAVCNPEAPTKERRAFLVLVTGQPFTLAAGRSLRFVATVQQRLPGGDYVEHVFEVVDDERPERWHAVGESH